MWEMKIPSGVRVPDRASACVTNTPFLPQWFCGSPISYSWGQSAEQLSMSRWMLRSLFISSCHTWSDTCDNASSSHDMCFLHHVACHKRERTIIQKSQFNVYSDVQVSTPQIDPMYVHLGFLRLLDRDTLPHLLRLPHVRFGSSCLCFLWREDISRRGSHYLQSTLA